MPRDGRSDNKNDPTRVEGTLKTLPEKVETRGH